MNRITTVIVATLIAGASAHQPALTAASLNAPATAGTVAVKVQYKGKGTVDGKHQVWVWLFTTPDIQPGAMPIAQLSVAHNGEVAVFEGVPADKVWIVAAFDEQGTMDGMGPPPSGTPVGIYADATGAPAGVVPGDKKESVLTFDDSFRMP